MKLLDRVAIVTGGSGCIGRSIVEEFAKEGADVVFTYLKDKTNADDLILRTEQYKRKIIGLQCDVRNFEDVKNVVDTTIKEFNKIDILVNNAGTAVQNYIENLDESGWDITIDTDLKGPYFLTRLVVPIMKKQSFGKIINISSHVGFSAIPRHSVHGAAKAGLIGFSKNLAVELAPYKINVNVIAPGTIETSNFPTDYYKKISNFIPMKRVGKPTDVARAAVFLASSDSDFIAGDVLVVDGAHSLVVRYD